MSRVSLEKKKKYRPPYMEGGSIYIYMYIYKKTYVYIYVCVCIYIYTHTHTHTHTVYHRISTLPSQRPAH